MSWHRANIRNRRCGHEGGSTGTSRSGDAFMGTARPLLAALAITSRNRRGICARSSPPQGMWQVEIWPDMGPRPTRMRRFRRTRKAGFAADGAAGRRRWPLASPGQTEARRIGPQQHILGTRATLIRWTHKAAAGRTMATRNGSARTTGASRFERPRCAARSSRAARSPCVAPPSCNLRSLQRGKSAAESGIRRGPISVTAEERCAKTAKALCARSLKNKMGRQDGRLVGASLRARQRSRQPSTRESRSSLAAWQHTLGTFSPTRRTGQDPFSSCLRLLCPGIRPELCRSRSRQAGLPMLIWNVVFIQTPEP